MLENGPLEVAVTQTSGIEEPKLHVTATGTQPMSEAESTVIESVERLLGPSIDLEKFYQFANRDQRLKPLVERFKGVKPPRFLTVFEALVNGIVCQQISLTNGIRLLNRLTTTYGIGLRTGTKFAHAFPRPEELAGLRPEALRKLGLSYNKASALIDLAHAVTEGLLDFENLTNLNDDEARASLDQLRGVGRWTAEYVMLRGLGREHVFPSDDAGGRNNLRRWLNLDRVSDGRVMNRTLNQWKPYGGLIYFHLLLDRLEERGYLS